MSESLPAPCAIDVSEDALSVRLALSGDANMDAVDAVAAALDGAHARALSSGRGTVIVDVTRLEFMNSTCFKKVLTWIGKLAEADPPPYVIRFLSDPRIRWQKRSLHALEAFAAGVVTVERT